MLRHKLYDPISRDPSLDEIEFQKYVDIHKHQTEPTKPELVKALKDDFYSSHAVDKSKLDKIWNFVGKKIEENVGIAEFIRDNNGQLSDYFFPWLINVFRSPSTALEMSYGAGPDLNGDWWEDILDTDDPLVPFIRNDPAFVYNRERQLFVTDLATSIQDIGAEHPTRRPLKIVDFGAGRLAWVKRHGFAAHPDLARIYAFDKDPSIKPDLLFAQDLESLGIRYKHGDFTAQFTNPDCKEADLIILGGVASYIPPELFASKIVPGLHQLLLDDGVLFFDLQLDCPCYRHSMDILDWSAFDCPAEPSEIIDRIEAMRKSLWLNGTMFSAEYHIDTFNKIPSAVMIVMQKVT